MFYIFFKRKTEFEDRRFNETSTARAEPAGLQLELSSVQFFKTL